MPMLSGSKWPIPPEEVPDAPVDVPITDQPQTAVLGGGCFWCTEAVFNSLDGVLDVTSGYAGGAAETADYRSVCTGGTGHAEVIRIRFDPRRITFGQLLKVFFSVAHDPTQRNRQGNDWGTQYRSVVFYADEAQRAAAAAYVDTLSGSNIFGRRLATTVEPLTAFYEAEAYHQDYSARNPNAPYVTAVAMPKVRLAREWFGNEPREGPVPGGA